ncbi:hypothetical protein BDV11DRAFT_179987 [Aspergillus similis]
MEHARPVFSATSHGSMGSYGERWEQINNDRLFWAGLRSFPCKSLTVLIVVQIASACCAYPRNCLPHDSGFRIRRSSYSKALLNDLSNMINHSSGSEHGVRDFNYGRLEPAPVTSLKSSCIPLLFVTVLCLVDRPLSRQLRGCTIRPWSPALMRIKSFLRTSTSQEGDDRRMIGGQFGSLTE